MTTNLFPVPEFPMFDTSNLDKYAESVRIQIIKMSQSINALQMSSGGSPGTVTSVGLAVPVEFSVSGSPVTTAGTITIAKATETANTVWAGPTTGAAAQPTFRALVAADIPGAPLTATYVGYGSGANTLTGTSDLTYVTATSVLAQNNASTMTRTMTETTDSTAMTETKVQPLHQFQITNKVRTPGSIGAIQTNTSGDTVTSYVTVPDSSSIKGFGTTFSFTGWWYVDALWAINVNTARIFEKTGSYKLEGSWSSNLRRWQLTLTGTSGANTWNLGSNVGIPTAGAWNFICVTYDGATATFYLNGSSVATQAATGSITDTTNGLAIGNGFNSPSSTAGPQGRLDEFRFYKATLTPAQITAYYNSGAGIFTGPESSPLLTAGWHFDEAAGTTVADLSGNGNTGTLAGTAPPTFATGLIVGSPTLTAQNIIKHTDGATSGETAILTIGATGDTVNLVGSSVQVNGSSLLHPLLDANFDSDTTASTVVRGDLIIGNSTPKWTRLAIGATGTVPRSDGTDIAFGAVDGATITGAFTDVTNGNVSSTKHGFAPKSPADATQFLNGAATPAFAAVKDSDLSTSDITTNNSSSTKHGFAVKSPADATQFLNGAATPAYAAVKDSDLSTSDITTNDVSTSKHGFAPKGDGNASHFLTGTGVYAAAAGSGTVTNTGTLTAHNVILGNGTSDILALGSLGTSGQFLKSNGAGADPSWATLTGGGNVTTSATLTANALVLGNAGVDVGIMGSLGTTTTVLHGNAAGAPTFGAIVNGDITNSTIDLTTKVTGVLPIANGGTGVTGGAMVRLDQKTPTGTTADFTSIPAGYSSLIVKWIARDTKTANTQTLSIKINNDGTSGNYSAGAFLFGSGSAASSSTNSPSSSGLPLSTIPAASASSSFVTQGEMEIVGYAGTTFFKKVGTRTYETRGAPAEACLLNSGTWKSTAAINQITFTTDGTAFVSGSTFTLYGLP